MTTPVPGPGTCDSQDCLHTFSPDTVVDHAEVLPAVLHPGLLDDEGPSNLLNSLIQSHGLLVVVVLHELVPPRIIEIIKIIISISLLDNLAFSF